ncbi:hypothetical protein [Undibacterium rugosum]|nr:hypothetical protein [Undibacterium rugosum]MBR7780265.1 hypothetical protein [Undibacterium rugosum]
MKIRQTLFQRSVASIVLLTFSSLTLYPAGVSAQAHEAAEKAGLLTRLKDEGLLGNTQRYLGKLAGQSGVNANTVPAVASVSPDEQFSQLLAGIHDELKALDTAATPAAPSAAPMAKAANPMARNSSDISARSLKNASPPAVSSVQTQKRIERVQLKIQALKKMYAGIEQSFNDTEQQLKAANMPAEILQRHHAAVAQYQSRQKQFQQFSEQVERSSGAEQQRALVELSRFMGTHQNAKPHQFTDPNKLPFGSPSNKVRKPNETKAEYQASLFPPKYDKIMLAGAIPDGLKLAQASLPVLPVAQDTAETEDIQLTPAVKAKAQELNNNPVQIYNWVRSRL